MVKLKRARIKSPCDRVAGKEPKCNPIHRADSFPERIPIFSKDVAGSLSDTPKGMARAKYILEFLIFLCEFQRMQGIYARISASLRREDCAKLFPGTQCRNTVAPSASPYRAYGDQAKYVDVVFRNTGDIAHSGGPSLLLFLHPLRSNVKRIVNGLAAERPHTIHINIGNIAYITVARNVYEIIDHFARVKKSKRFIKTHKDRIQAKLIGVRIILSDIPNT